MTKFKDTEAYEDLQGIIGSELAGIYLGRLKEFGVPEDRLGQVADDICYDIVSAMNMVGDYEIYGADPIGAGRDQLPLEAPVSAPQANQPSACMEETTEEEVLAEAERTENEPPLTQEPAATPGSDAVSNDDDAYELAYQQAFEKIMQEEDTDDLMAELSAHGLDFMEEKTDRNPALDVEDTPALTTDKGVMSQADILRVLNAAKSA